MGVVSRGQGQNNNGTLPHWVPLSVKNYLAHTETGTSIRALAREGGCHASTILRQIRRVETRRDDPLVDAALRSLGALQGNDKSKLSTGDYPRMTKHTSPIEPPLDAGTLNQESTRILRRLCESGAVLAVAAEMEKAVVVRDGAAGISTRTAVVDCAVAEAMALKGWIASNAVGRITRYKITAKGRSALTDMMAKMESAQARKTGGNGFADAQTPFDPAPETDVGAPQPRRRMRYSIAESPLTALARRRDKDGSPFLNDDLVHVGERLREDFELSQMGQRVAQDWDRFLTAPGNGGGVGGSGPTGPSDARARVANALRDLGPGLADVVLRCCCHLEGLETAEKRLGWSARSGKIVLRIALMRLKQHYDETTGPGGPMIG
ncbi:helix-turn-helix domain containing protein [Sulfitobacter sp. SK012]|uniref:DUF6456 domain-containing protein n=1 Tax=Sulfitobacter sp. SK012 TaxID=1389005 RepID=UPI000E0B49F9|nr:DUF6456 domain-containing protein [Sulfitobacter sp. SK012]AXI46807.1 helix-turn-helix domain containing protein [Sulfitobacter sp. SK012]